MKSLIKKIASLLLCALLVLSGIRISLIQASAESSLADDGAISECRVSRDKKSISIKGSVSDELLSSRQGALLLLYELDLACDSEGDGINGVPLAQIQLTKNEFSFTVPLDEHNDALYKKYAVMIYHEGEISRLCDNASINNPEIFAESNVVTPDGKKGIWPLDGNYVLDGIDQSAMEIDAGKLMTLDPGEGIAYTYGGERFYFSRSYVESIDKKMAEYESNGIAMRFILKLIRPSDVLLASRLCHPSSEGDGCSAFNTDSDEGIRALRAITDFLVRRYALSEVSQNLYAITISSQVNDAYNNYNLSDASLEYFVSHYAAALRTVYYASRSVCSNFAVGISLGGDWNGGSDYGQGSSFDARTVLDALSAHIKAETDISWELCYDITPNEGSYAWEELSPDLSFEARKITAANIEVLTSYLSLSQFRYNGAQRNIVLLGTSRREAVNESDRLKYSADYIYTYLRISNRNMKQITGYIPCHDADYANAIRYVGTNLFEERSQFFSDLIGSERFNALMSESGGATDRVYSENVISNTPLASVKGQAVLFSFEKDEGGFVPSLNCSSLEGSLSYSGVSGILRAKLESAEGGVMKGVSVTCDSPLDLTHAPYLSFSVRSFLPTENTDSIMLVVAVWSGDSVHVSRGSITVGSEASVLCDLRSFTGLSSCDRIGIYLCSDGGDDIGEATLMITSVTALSETMSGGELDEAIHNPSGWGKKTVTIYTVTVLSLIAVSAVAFETVRIVRKLKRTEENE